VTARRVNRNSLARVTHAARIRKPIKLQFSRLTPLLLAAVSLCCHLPRDPINNKAQSEEGGEPEQYSGRIVRTIDRDGRSEVIEGRFARLGQMRREEWTEHGEPRILIWRPDLGKAFLLFPTDQAYVESSIQPEATSDFSGGQEVPASERTANYERAPARPATRATPDRPLSPAEVDQALESAAVPDNVESTRLPDQTIDSHLCKVFQRRATYSDGHSETTRTYRAGDLHGLALKTENEETTGSGSSRVTTELSEIREQVAASEFEIPAGFRKRTTTAARP
jgi:hypothetical protein